MGDQVSKQATIGTILCFFSAPCDFFFFNLTSSFHSTILRFPIESISQSMSCQILPVFLCLVLLYVQGHYKDFNLACSISS
jgi:hypothetical protein